MNGLPSLVVLIGRSGAGCMRGPSPDWRMHSNTETTSDEHLVEIIKPADELRDIVLVSVVIRNESGTLRDRQARAR